MSSSPSPTAVPFTWPQPDWQCVLVAWGDKYPVEEINYLIANVRLYAATEPRFVLITDRERPGLDPAVETRDFPPFFGQDAFRSAGCHAKLAMFEAGVLPHDMPTIYLDIDTIVLGDVSRLFAHQKTRQSISLFQSAAVPFGPVGRFLYRVTGKRKYARGNSSLIVFCPSECTYVAEGFRDKVAQYPDFSFRPMVADERFISWIAQPHMQALPSTFAVKFPTEFMFPLAWFIYLRALLPLTRRRRAGLQVITLPGVDVKAEELLALHEGDVVTDRKGRKLIWSDRALGITRQRIIDYYRPLVEQLKAHRGS